MHRRPGTVSILHERRERADRRSAATARRSVALLCVVTLLGSQTVSPRGDAHAQAPGAPPGNAAVPSADRIDHSSSTATPEAMEIAFRNAIAAAQAPITRDYLADLEKLRAQYAGSSRSADAQVVVAERRRADRILQDPGHFLFPLADEKNEATTRVAEEGDRAEEMEELLRRFGLVIPLPRSGDKRFLPEAAARQGGVVLDAETGAAGGFRESGDSLTWELKEGAVAPGEYEIILEYAAARTDGGGTVGIRVGDAAKTAALPGFGNWDQFRHHTVGRFEIDSLPSKLTISTRRAAGSEGACLLGAVILRRVQD